MCNGSRKHQKVVDRRKRKEQKARSLEKANALVQLKANYPDVVFTGQADPGFEKMIREAVAQLPLHSQEIPLWERDVYRKIKSQGLLAALKLLAKLDAVAARDSSHPVDLQFFCGHGHRIFRRCGESLKSYLKWNDVWIRCSNRNVEAHFRRLHVERTPQGKVYSSPLRPQAVIKGRRYTVGYSTHALERIANRVHVNWEQYANHGDLFGLLYDTACFVGCEIQGDDGINQPAVAMYQKYIPSQIFRGITAQATIAHLQEDDGTGLFILIGYLPVALNEGIAVAKTYLLPGWYKTPEYSSYFNKQLPRGVADQLREIGTEDNPGGAFLHSNPIVLRFFHQSGFPQVLRGSDPSFAHLSPSEFPSIL